MSPNQAINLDDAVSTVTRYNLRVLDEPGAHELARYASQTDWPCAWLEVFLRGTAGANTRIAVLLMSRGDDLAAIAFATIARGKLGSVLKLHSNPRILDSSEDVLSAFWEQLRQYCKSNRVQQVKISSFESKYALPSPPPLGKVEEQELRREFFVDLTPDESDILASFSSNHRRNIKKAAKNDVLYVKSEDPDGLDSHLSAFEHTKGRREDRAEAVIGINVELCRKLLQSGSAYLMQARKDEHVLSSFLMVETPTSAFYFSGGTTSEGMKLGASQGLMWQVIQDLKSRGVETLTLGGAPDGGSDGLNRYKLGFGAFEVNASNYSLQASSSPLVKLIRKVQQWRSDSPAVRRQS